jgi:hypothetical protein
MESDNQSIEAMISCPVCSGTGSITETYPYRTQHKYDGGGKSFQHAERCWLCGGENGGRITPEQHEEWLKYETYPTCPLCNGTGGKRYWSWQEDEHGSHKAFTFTRCRLCQGKRKVSPEKVFQYNREKQQLRFWGVGCTALIVVLIVVGATQGLTALLNGTPWLRCCPAPGLIPLGVIALHLSRRFHGL